MAGESDRGLDVGAGLLARASALRSAALRGDAAFIAKEGADPELIDAVDQRGNSPLMLASRKLQAASVALLLALGASSELENSWGETALWQAVSASRGDGRVIVTLLAFGADENHANHSGVTPKQLARGDIRFRTDRFFSRIS